MRRATSLARARHFRLGQARGLSQRTASSLVTGPYSIRTRALRATIPNVPHALRSLSAGAQDDAAPKAEILGVPYSQMSIGVPKETFALERRVSQTPESVKKLVDAGFTVKVESGAGALSEFSDAMYEAAGAQIVPADEAWRCAVVTHIRPPTPEEAAKVGDRTLCSMIWPAQNPDLVAQLEKQGATALAMDCIPRTLSRGQVLGLPPKNPQPRPGTRTAPQGSSAAARY
mmetsp:Transcript_37427/g.83750  ORF Transcript_37427/g.83750 Transcript_37427/m.83750 type:complete len:230 (+) Transcript_37427:122-811(+)